MVKDASLKDHIGRVGDVPRWYSQGWFAIKYKGTSIVVSKALMYM